MKRTFVLTGLFAAMLAGSAFAQNASTPNIDKRQANQEKRIDNGVKSGALTGKETENLEKREAKIETDKEAAKADGKVTKGERRHLRKEEDRTSRAIFKKKHNKKTAASASQS